MSVALKPRTAFDWPRFAVELVLVIAVCALAARWATTLFTGAPLTAPAQGSVGTPPAAGDDKRRALLASAPLFGARAMGTVSENIQPMGVIAENDGPGSAIISVDGQPPRAFQIGEDVGGRKLVAIEHNEIQLEGGGVRTPFRLPEQRVSLPPGSGIAAARPE